MIAGGCKHETHCGASYPVCPDGSSGASRHARIWPAGTTPGVRGPSLGNELVLSQPSLQGFVGKRLTCLLAEVSAQTFRHGCTCSHLACDTQQAGFFCCNYLQLARLLFGISSACSLKGSQTPSTHAAHDSLSSILLHVAPQLPRFGLCPTHYQKHRLRDCCHNSEV